MAEPDSPEPPSYAVASSTHFGQNRDHNEDYLVVLEPGPEREVGLLILCDGMGGPASGEVASQLAAETIRDVLETEYSPGGDAESALSAAVTGAQTALREHQVANTETQGMGCTVLAGLVDGTTLSLGHLGDCRCYVATDDEMRSLTLDHSWAAELFRAGALKTEEEVRTHSRRHVLTRFLGGRDPGAVEADFIQHEIAVGERLLMCTDGLWDMVRDDRIHEIVRGDDLEATVAALIQAANDGGGKDNISVILFERTA